MPMVTADTCRGGPGTQVLGSDSKGQTLFDTVLTKHIHIIEEQEQTKGSEENLITICILQQLSS